MNISCLSAALTRIPVGFIEPGEQKRPLEFGITNDIFLHPQSCNFLFQIITLSKTFQNKK
jgi:hypothetical protein